MKRLLLTTLFAILGLAAHAAEDAATYQVGDRIDPIELKDQHDQTHSIGPDTRLLLFTTGMKGGAVVREVLDQEAPDYLASNNAAFVSNISGMPRFIASTVALPSMRGHKYPIILDRSGDTTRRLPSQEDSATLIRLQGLQIQSIEFTKSSQAVREAIHGLPEEAPSSP
jgi:hypothetical protein